MIAKPHASGRALCRTPEADRGPNLVRCDQEFSRLGLQQLSTPSLSLTAVTSSFFLFFLNTGRHHSFIFILLSSSMGQNTVPSKFAFPAFHGLNSTYSFPPESASIFRAGAFDLHSEGVIWLLAQGPS